MTIPKVIPDDWTPTVREKIIDYLMALAAAMKHQHADDESSLFQNVYRGDPDDMPNLKVVNAPFCCVEDGEEQTIGELTSMVTVKRMAVYIHVRFAKGQQGVDPYEVFNYYLSRLQVAILTDYRLGGTCRRVEGLT